ncbi:MFS general substrate transporter [Mycena indigotica]|uniref:MFS general substrate transporter n=1 Tax=Mycena indigotica TaxID=2126181 RepID=A0A8H6TCW3_9AGAR|nr:MFS general substrate transporter [Mycena indigotica]KAF7314989.1 MFS general substrate transporter [Mycena indigotica]
MAATESTPLLARPATKSRREFAMMMAGLWSFAFIASLDGTIVATLLSTIGSSLQSLQTASAWLGTAYLLSLTTSTPLYGRLANILGRRPSIMLAGFLFAFGTILCGCATTIWQLVALRAIAGLGGGGLTVVGSVIVSDVVPLKSRGLYQGFANLLFGLGGAVGGPLGGYLGDTIGWRAAFLIQGPILAIGLFLVFVTVAEPPHILAAEGVSLLSKLKRIDYAGVILLTTCLVAFLLGMNYKTIFNHEWSDPLVWGFLLISILLFVAFIAIEFKIAAEPIMPVAMLHQRTPLFVAIHNFILSVLSFSTLYNVPLFFIAALLRTSANAGAHLVPNSFAVAVGSLFAGWYMRHTGRYWTLQAFGGSGLILANIVLSTWSRETPEWVLYVTLMPSGFGLASTLTTTLLALIASVPREDIPLATGLSYLFRTTGQVLGVSLSAAVTQTLLAKELRRRIDDDEIISNILSSTTYIRTLPPHLQEEATASWMKALHVVFTCQIVVAVALFFSSLPVEELPLPDTVDNAVKPSERRSDNSAIEVQDQQ